MQPYYLMEQQQKTQLHKTRLKIYIFLFVKTFAVLALLSVLTVELWMDCAHRLQCVVNSSISAMMAVMELNNMLK